MLGKEQKAIVSLPAEEEIFARPFVCSLIGARALTKTLSSLWESYLFKLFGDDSEHF